MKKDKHKALNGLIPETYRFNLSDFALFLSVMKNKSAYECTLSIILEEEHIELKEVKVEKVILNRSGKRAIRLDAWAKDGNNREFDMEMQNDSAGDDLPRHSRFYQGMLDTPILKSGKRTKIVNEVKESEEWEAVQMNIFEIGVSYGEERGEERGEKRLNLLHKKLLDENRIDDLRRSIEDEKYQKKLYKEYHI